MSKKNPPDLNYNIIGAGSAWDCVDRCYKKYLHVPSREAKKTLKGAIENLALWSVELQKSIRRRSS